MIFLDSKKDCGLQTQMTQWRDILEIKGYQVSDDGRVRSVDRLDQLGKRWKGKELRPGKDKDGYLQVSLCEDGVAIKRKIHRLVAVHFIPNPIGLPEVNHMHPDGDKTRNNVDNLEWITSSGNNLHATRVMRKHIGEAHCCAVLSAIQVEGIKQRLRNGERKSALAKEFGVSYGAIAGIQQGTSWADLL